MHINCDCNAGIIDEHGNVVFMLDSKGMFPKDGEDRPELLDYLRRTLKAVTLGYFSDEAPTILSIAINIILGFSAVGLLADVRDIIGCIVNFDNTPESWFELIISLMAIIPLLDSLKYVDEVVDVANPVVKNSDEAADIVKNILKNEYGAIGKVVVKNGDEAADIAKAALKNSDTDKLIVRHSKYLNDDGNIDWEKWAPNGGRVLNSIQKDQTLDVGTIIDRYGNMHGKYVSPIGVTYEQRALPYIENQNAYHKYKVLKPINHVTISQIAPAFEQPGGGIQYELPLTIKELISKGFLEEIK